MIEFNDCLILIFFFISGMFCDMLWCQAFGVNDLSVRFENAELKTRLQEYEKELEMQKEIDECRRVIRSLEENQNEKQ